METFKFGISVNLFRRHTGWVLDGLIRDAARYTNTQLHWNIFPEAKLDYLNSRVIRTIFLPATRRIALFGHHESFIKLNSKKIFSQADSRVFLTHLNEGLEYSQHDIELLGQADRLFVQNHTLKRQLLGLGLQDNKIFLAPGAIDKGVFFPNIERNTTRFVLLSGYFKYRKNPVLISQVIRAMPELEFIIHGEFISEFPPDFLSSCSNVTWLQFDINRQPKLMREASLYLSLSRIEGGPIGILEALASGTPVVATDTGFASEYVSDQSGKLLTTIPTVEEVVQGIRETLLKFENISPICLLKDNLTWEQLGNSLFGNN